MILIYLSAAIIFYLLFPVALAFPAPSVTGAVVIGLTSGAILLVAEVIAIRLYLQWHTSALSTKDVNFFPFGAAAVISGGAVAAILCSFPLAKGFAQPGIRLGSRHEGSFWLMVAIPPALYAAMKFRELWKGARSTEVLRQAIVERSRK